MRQLKEAVVLRCAVKIITAVSLVFGCSSLTASKVPHFKIEFDTLKIGTCDGVTNFAFTLLKDVDTIRTFDCAHMTFYSATDSLKVRAEEKFVPIVIEGATRTLHLTCWFALSEDRYDEFVAILRDYPEFGHAQPPMQVEFAYANSKDPNLEELREKYKLDQVAGSGSEVSRIINLMEWVHKKIPHDGEHGGPLPANSLNILKVNEETDRAVNCRSLATVLNEVYLSEGFVSRHLTCLPKDTTDVDCHVVNMVWCDSLSKWLYMDPTNQVYFMDEDGVIMSPLEVREAFIAGTTADLDTEADYNGTPLNPIQYKGYMAKNLFSFSVPLKSVFGYESLPGDLAWVYLNPVGYESKRVGHAESSKGKSGTYTDYITDNATWFWGR